MSKVDWRVDYNKEIYQAHPWWYDWEHVQARSKAYAEINKQVGSGRGSRSEFYARVDEFNESYVKKVELGMIVKSIRPDMGDEIKPERREM